ncbi:probable chitinase 10 [Cloeon dipterum]|uniref:probable chitinase 10 n=1 Tax=Cloeon dipterum TaxID=197152 RepID=UPI0032204CE6
MPQTISPKLFSAIAKNDDQRNSFVVDVVSIVKNYNLDGLNIRWIFPGSPFAASEGFLADKSNYVTLLSNFTSLLKPGGLLLTTECSGNKAIISRGLDIPKVAEAVDYLFVYATDYGGTRFSFTSLSTPNKEVRQSLEVFKNQINDDDQIILSIKPDVEIFDLLKSNKLAKIGVPTVTDKREQMAWNKFLYRVLVTEKGKWEITKSNNEALQSFACDGTKWASYDDMFSIQQRMEIVRNFGLGGVHVVAVFNDDIANDIGCGPAPVLRSINEIVRGFNECVLPSCP